MHTGGALIYVIGRIQVRPQWGRMQRVHLRHRLTRLSIIPSPIEYVKKIGEPTGDKATKWAKDCAESTLYALSMAGNLKCT